MKGQSEIQPVTLPRPAMSAPPTFTVVVPAHDEARVIARTLNTMLGSWPDDSPPHVIVACNGCSDATAEEARRAAPQADVIELTAASKIAAINVGLERARAYPIIIVDADVGIAPRSLIAVANALRAPRVMAASPASLVDTTGSDVWTRAYYRVWTSHSYMASGIGGSGVYGLSQAGAEAIGRLPEVTGDDTFVRWFFPLSQQRRIAMDGDEPVRSMVSAPARIGDLLACEMRWHAGNLQLRKSLAEPTDAGGAAPGKTRPMDRAVYYAIKLLGRAGHAWAAIRGRSDAWHRDSSRR